MENLEWRGYRMMKKLRIWLLILTQDTNVTGSKTDRQTLCHGITHTYACIASRGKNRSQNPFAGPSLDYNTITEKHTHIWQLLTAFAALRYPHNVTIKLITTAPHISFVGRKHSGCVCMKLERISYLLCCDLVTLYKAFETCSPWS